MRLAAETVGLETEGSLRARSARRAAVVGSLGVVVLSVATVGGSVARGAPERVSVAAHAPARAAGELTDVAAVPHSTDVWAIRSLGTPGNAHYVMARLHHGHPQRVKPPKLGGRYGQLNAVAAASARSVWVGGGRQQAHGIQEVPAIWQWSGKKFVAQKLPTLVGGGNDVSSISASSPNNAWAVGGFYPGNTAAQVALHWNGKKWSAVTVPSGYAQSLDAVSVSSPTNAWALRSDSALVHWNGTVWSVQSAAPAGVTLDTIATTSPKLAYAGGYTLTSRGAYRAVILKFNGTTWSRASVAKRGAHAGISAVSMHGKSAWALGALGTRAVILHSTGAAWKAENLTAKSVALFSITAQSARHAYAVGYYDVPGSDKPAKTFLDYYNGHSWKEHPSTF